MSRTETEHRKRRTTLLLAGLALGMFAFGFALVPLYDLICQVTGVQSVALRTAMALAEPTENHPLSSRSVVVKFDTSIHPNLPWEFEAGQTRIEVVPGQMYEVMFKARNRSSAAVTGQAIPSVVPWQATPYFSKLECFCFNKQQLDGGESADMPLRFVVSPDLPTDINSLTLAYNFMKISSHQPAARTNNADDRFEGNLYVSQ